MTQHEKDHTTFAFACRAGCTPYVGGSCRKSVIFIMILVIEHLKLMAAVVCPLTHRSIPLVEPGYVRGLTIDCEMILTHSCDIKSSAF